MAFGAPGGVGVADLAQAIGQDFDRQLQNAFWQNGQQQLANANLQNLGNFGHALGNLAAQGQAGLAGLNPWEVYGRFWIDPETAARSRERARGLLKTLVTPEQWAEFETAGTITEKIDGCEFKLRPGGMIEAKKPRVLLPAVRERWCVYPDPVDGNDCIPAEDKLIGQLLHLRAGPDQVRKMANVSPGQ